MDNQNQVSIRGEQDWTQVTRFIPPGEHVLEWRYARSSSSGNQNTVWLDEVTFTPSNSRSIAAAVDSGAGISWSTGEDRAWTGYATAAAFDGVDMVATPNLTSDETAWMEARVTGPGTATFNWRSSTESNDDLRFLLDGVLISTRNGNIDWQALSLCPERGDACTSLGVCEEFGYGLVR